MSSKQQITDESLIDLLEKQRIIFTDRYRPLLTAQATALQKANNLIAEPPESLKRNYPKKKANSILNDIKNCISPDVFVLCALATSLSALGTSKLDDYLPKIECWWEGVHHPKGLTIVSESYGMRVSELSSNKRAKSDELSEPQPSRRTRGQYNVAQSTDDFGLEPSVPVQSPVPTTQDSAITAAQPLRLNRLPTCPETSSQHSRILVSNLINPAPQKQMTRTQVTDEGPSKRPRLEAQQNPGNPALPGEGRYWSFSFTSRHMIENLPEPFRTGTKTSNLWRKESESGGLAVSNCLTMYLPQTNNEDALFVATMGYDDGFNICNLLGIGDPDILGSDEGSVEEARD